MAKDRAQMVTLKIPRPLYERLGQLIDGTGFRSVTEFATYVLRDLAAHPASTTRTRREEVSPRMTAEELDAARERLRELGYL